MCKNTMLIKEVFDYIFSPTSFEYKNIKKILKKLSIIQGFGVEGYVSVCFSAEFKKGEEDYFGENKVCFTFSEPAVETDIEIVITYEEFYEIVSKYFKEYADSNPKESEEIINLLSVVKKNLNL